MKKLLTITLPLATMLFFAACNGNNNEVIDAPENVNITLDYSFFESGEMSRSGEVAYNTFFENYIKTKQIAPRNYNLTFTGTSENASYAQMEGAWGGSGVVLREGTYNVIGNSTPEIYSSYKGGEDICDSLYLTFNEPVIITKSTEKVNLSAVYDCYLLLFVASNIKSIKASFGNKKLNQLGGLYYLFVRKDYYTTSGTTTYQTYLYLDIEKTDGTKINNLKIGGTGLEKGKYYFFNDMTNLFNIDPMLNGNE